MRWRSATAHDPDELGDHLSKKHGARKRRRKRNPPVACPHCHGTGDGSPGAILRALAFLLTESSKAGMRPKFAHGTLITREGVVLPPLDDTEWVARTRLYNPLAPADGDGLDD